ncbi:hypothetical protein NLI96_g8102 [Meripilus lineatus]|uniref:Uncharacterized protein n=1 Tax=Meripilus lineatus TaxID=2056292 RepID=A0AAD5V2P3_9APHY|nr:hypothetical protein NLI96_g8102 [Physisporinus lineatus]
MFPASLSDCLSQCLGPPVPAGIQSLAHRQFTMAEKAMLPVYQFLQDTVSALLYEYNLGFRADASFSLAAFSFTVLRSWASSEKSWLVLSTSFIPSFFVVGTNISFTGHTLATLCGPYSWKTLRIVRNRPIATRIAATLSDLPAIIALSVRMSDIRKVVTKSESSSPLTHFLLRSGIIYFVYPEFHIRLSFEVTTDIGYSASALLNTITVITTITGQLLNGVSSIFTDFSQCLNAILISRFILDLRSIDNELSQNTSFSSIRFMGNIGAPVSDRSVWTTSAADDIDNVQDERREENSTERDDLEITTGNAESTANVC